MFIGVELNEGMGLTGKDIVYSLLDHKIMCKQTKENVIRMAPPLTITSETVNKIGKAFKDVFENLKWS